MPAASKSQGPASKRVAAFIVRYALHRHGAPVSLATISDHYTVHYVPLRPSVYGVAYFASGVRFIAVNIAHHPFTQRMIVVHEVAHYVLGHSNGLFICRKSTWWYRHLEEQANIAAAKILVPEPILLAHLAAGMTVDQLQQIFEVPARLIEVAMEHSASVSQLRAYRQQQLQMCSQDWRHEPWSFLDSP